MKYITILVFILFFTSPFLIYSQVYTGSNQKICRGGCVELGKNPIDGYCYKWIDDTSNTISTASTAIVCPEESTAYRLNVTNNDGQLIATEEVEVNVIDELLNLTIYDAKVTFDDNEEYLPISEEEEESIGAQTFVNLDNDDENKYFDNESEIVETGDDELMRLEINSSKESVIIKALEGKDYIRIFKKESKGDLYELGTTLILEEDGNQYKGELWVEGIKPHIEQQATVLELLTLEDELSCTDKVAITIIGIEKIEWFGNKNGYAHPYHTSDFLDVDPNFPEGGLKGYRVFPDARKEAPTKPKDYVSFKVTLTVPFLRRTKIYVRTLDVDDPSKDTKFIDPNDNPTALIFTNEGKYSGNTGLTYTRENDNRGVVTKGENSYKFGYINGQDLNGIVAIAVNPNLSSIKRWFKTSQFAGDNYRLVANGDYDFLKNLRNKDKVDGFDIKDPEAGTVQKSKKYTSPVLTVWRLLHIESESMLNFKYGMYTQQIFTYARNLKLDTDDPTKIKKITVNTDLSNPTSTLVDPSIGGRFENGKVIFGVTNFEGNTDTGSVTSGNIESNDNTSITFINPLSISGLKCELTHPEAGYVIQATLGNITKVNTNYRWELNLSGGVTLAEFLGGTIRIGNSIIGINSMITAIENENTLLTNNLYIPIVVRDDDQEESANALPHNVDLSTTIKAFSKAYILPVNDGGGLSAENGGNVNKLPFRENYSIDTNDFETDLNAVHESKSIETQYFWVAYISSGWQGDFKVDGDPNSEDYLLGLTLGKAHNKNLSVGGDLSMYFVETHHDGILNFPSVRSEPHTVAHEIGHQFGLTHGDEIDSDGDGVFDFGSQISEYPHIGLMRSGSNDANNAEPNSFIPRHINLIRSRMNSPGQE